jgi:hypothetical protein
VHDQESVCRLDRIYYPEKEREALPQVELMRVSVGRDRIALYEFHRQPRSTVSERATIKQSGDVGMAKRRKDLPLGPETAHEIVGVEAATEDLDRDTLFERPVGPLGSVDRGHPAATDPLAHHEMAHPRPRREVDGLALTMISKRVCHEVGRGGRHTRVLVIDRSHASEDQILEDSGLGDRPVHQRLPLRDRQIERFREDGVYLCPPLPEQGRVTQGLSGGSGRVSTR